MTYEITSAYVQALTGSSDTVMDWRVINDRNKGEMGRNLRGSLAEVYQTLQQFNSQGWGVFACINAMDGQGQSLQNVAAIRTHVVDLDDVLTSQDSYQRALASNMPPHFAVQSSTGKFHLYWLTQQYVGNDFYTTQQRKLAQLYNGDPSIVDATRVLRVPGFYHCKNEPQMVHCWGLHGGARYSAQYVEQALQSVNVIEKYSSRHELGDPKLAAPDWNTLLQALHMLDPNELARDEWLSISAAFKQAGWNLVSEETLMLAWQNWCALYKGNDALGENQKLWNSLRDTQVGWGAFKRKTNIDAYTLFGVKTEPVKQASPAVAPPPMPEISGELISGNECREWFKDCYFVERFGQILTPSGRYMNSTQFNGAYGGKQFLISDAGSKVTDEAWKAALRSTVWTIPKVDHVRFLPSLPPMSIVIDGRGRKGLNTYQPANVQAAKGDVSIFLDHWAKIIPNDNDRAVLFAYLAHCIKYPGRKVPWAVLFQSVQGTGKTMFYELLRHALGNMYVYRPNAKELVSGGSKFNSWMRERLMIVVDEIKVDEKRELSEVLKPFITDLEIEIQAKGQDQETEDNAANWLFFTNHKDAIPLDDDERRYAIIFSPFQTKKDLARAGMDTPYFRKIWAWLREEGGLKYLTQYMLDYPVEADGLPVRAPITTSHAEAVEISKSPFEVLLDDLLSAKVSGFKGGYVSMPVLTKNIAMHKIRTPPPHAIEKALNKRGYSKIGYTPQPIPGEDMVRGSLLYALDDNMNVENYWATQLR